MIEKACDTDIILMHGFPASGKSSLNKMYIDKGYTIVSRDALGITMKKVLMKIQTSKKYIGKKLVIDATFPSIEVREPYIEYAKSVGKTIGCHCLQTSKDDALINGLLRMKKITGEFYYHKDEVPQKWKNNPQVFVFPGIFAFTKLKKTPVAREGFDQIVKSKFKRVWDNDGFENKAVFVDLDGTLRLTKDDSKYPIKLGNQYILPNTEEVLKKYKDDGYLILGVSNQSGVNKGKMIDKVELIIEETNSLIGGIIDETMYCPHQIPKEICICRKPQSGMGLYLRDKYKLDLDKCIMVGDRTTDKTFATRLGIKYYTEKEFFNR